MKKNYSMNKSASITLSYKMYIPEFRNKTENSLIIYTTTQFSGKWVNRSCPLSGKPSMN